MENNTKREVNLKSFIEEDNRTHCGHDAESSYSRFAIIQNFTDGGTQTLEDYDSMEKVLESFEYIRANSNHQSENDGEIQEIDEDVVSLSMDIEMFDEENNHIRFATIKHTAIFRSII